MIVLLQQHNLNSGLITNISAVLNEQKSRPGYAQAVEANDAIDTLSADLSAAADVAELQGNAVTHLSTAGVNLTSHNESESAWSLMSYFKFSSPITTREYAVCLFAAGPIPTAL